MDATITVTGNVGSDIDLRVDSNNEWAYAAFRMASTPRMLRNGVWRDGETTWLNINCRNRSLSLNVHASIVKGDPVVVTGRLATWSWINKETGEVQDKLVLEAVSVGHDLCRGTSTFQRAERATPEPSVNDGEIFRNLENIDGNASQHSATSGQAEQAA
ncbi:MAG TPA: single-stranded DNA-binding protein [Micropruina sp.]|nr:single-stranded DNA-binding protein [Micropruina sp.]